MINSYETAAAYLGRKDDRPLGGRATRLQRREDGAIGVCYQGTDVVQYQPDGRIILTSAGWRTVTTKARMNEYSPARVGSDRGTWYVVAPPRYWDGPRYRFEDGITLGPDGRPIEGWAVYDDPARATVQKRVDRAVSRYIKGYAAHVAESRTLTQPGPGDCWGCYFQVQGAPEVRADGYRRQAPTPHGRVEPMGIDHYLEHIGLGADDEAPYYVPSLLANAIRARGPGSPAYVWALLEGAAKRGDGRPIADELRGYFRRLKPQIVQRMIERGQPCGG